MTTTRSAGRRARHPLPLRHVGASVLAWSLCCGVCILLLTLIQSVGVVRANLFSPQDVPGPPEKILISSASDSAVRVQFLPPEHIKAEGMNGAPVLGYKVEVAKRVNDVQTFKVEASGPILAGAYKITFTNAIGDVGVTSCIPWNATEVEFEMALEELPNVDAVSVTRSVYGAAAMNGYVYAVEFDGKYLVSGQQPNVLIGDQVGCQATLPHNRALTFTGAHVTVGVPGYSPEVWEVTTSDSAGANVLGGSFDLSLGFEGSWIDSTVTATVAAGSKTAITSSSMVGKVNRGNMIMIGAESFVVHASAPFTDTELPLDSYHIRGTTAATVYVEDTALGDVAVTQTSQDVATATDFQPLIGVNEFIKIGQWEFKVTAITSTTLKIAKIATAGNDNWPDASAQHITAYRRKKVTVSANAEAVEVKKALDGLPGIGKVDVTRYGPTSVNGYRWLITLLSLGSKTNYPESPSLYADETTGTSVLLTDVFGAQCLTCAVSASLLQNEAQTQTYVGITGKYESTSVVATKEVGGVVGEVQSISTQAMADDLDGTFAVNFRNSFAQSPGAVINSDDTALDVQVKLQNLPTVGRLNVTRMDNVGSFGVMWTVTFLSNTGDLPLFTVDSTLLTGTNAVVVVKEVVKGVEVPFEAIVDGLSPKVEYYVRAYARNLNGYGTGTDLIQRDGKGALPLYARVGSAPDAPAITGVWPVSGSEMEVQFTDPANHGASVQRLVFEYAVGTSFGTPAAKKLQIYNALANDIAGTFRLQYGDEVSPLLSVHTSAKALSGALRSLSNLRPVDVTRATFVLTGDVSSRVLSFVADQNTLTTTPLTAFHSQLLVAGARIVVESDKFTVKTQPLPGSTKVEVQPNHGVVSYNAQSRLVLKIDDSGSELGPFGYEWTISFASEIAAVADSVYPGLQLLSSLSSVESGVALATVGLSNKQIAVPPTHYGSFDISNEESCDTYVIGAPSPVQVLQLFAATTITQGTFQLRLGQETTACITLGSVSAKSTMKAALEALDFVSRVAVEEQRLFKVSVLTGSAASKVTAYDSVLSTITVVSSGGLGLSANEAKALATNALIQVSRNPNDFSRHSCELKVTVDATAGDTSVKVGAVSACASFTDESRSLKVLDFHDYKIRFWGNYPTGQWPTLKIVPATFGKGACTAWAPAAIPVYSKIHTVKYEGVCAQGSGGTQTILADASSDIGGWFSLSYLGNETPSLAFQSTSASDMRAAIDSITSPGTVNVSVSQYGSYGKAWHITFVQQHEQIDTIFIKHSYLTGQGAFISVYPTIEVFTTARQNDISGTFRLAFGGETTERIGFAATHMKVTQELQKLVNIDSVIVLGDADAGDIGVYPLTLTASAVNGNAVLTDIQLNGKSIDPTLFVAIREKLTIGVIKYWIRAVSPMDITLTAGFGGVTGSVTVLAGMITKKIKALPGYVGISRLMRVITATRGGNSVELPVDHGYVVGDVFFIAGQKFTVATVSSGVITTIENFVGAGSDVVAANPELYVFDNKLRTTDDLRHLLTVGENLWLQSSSSADMVKYTVSQVAQRFVLVDGVFSVPIVKGKAFHVSSGHRWPLVFRSYVGNLEAVDAIPANDWRGTDVRIGAKRANVVQPQVVQAGNPATIQTVLLEANTVADAVGAKFKLTFGDETTQDIAWGALESDIKQALEALDAVDGVSVSSIVYENGFVLSITFWGIYPTRTLPVMTGSINSAAGALGSVRIRIRSNNAVAHSKQDNLVLQSDQNYLFRIFAINARGISDSKMGFSSNAATTSVVPTPPTSVSLGEYRGETWLSVHYRPPFYTGGVEVTMYRLEWDSSPTFDSSSADYGVVNIQKRFEVQQVTTTYRSDAGIGGTFILSWGGRATTPLAIDCTADQMTDALAVITDTVNVAVDPVKVTRAQASWGYIWKITFLHNPGDLALLVADGSLMAGDFPRVSVTEVVQGFADLAIGDFTHEVQDIFTDAKTLLAGSFKLEFEDKISQAISVDASALEMQDALQATTTIYSIKVSKLWRNQALNTAIWSVTFAYLRGEEMVGAGNVFTIAVADATALTGTGASVKVANKITGSDPFTYTATGLRTGVQYYFHVMAYNAQGFGSTNSPMSSAITCGHPEPPKSVVASVMDGKTLSVTWAPSEKNGGCPIDKYRVEWYRAEGIREEQTVTTSAGKGLPEIQRLINFADSQSIGGYFKLSFKGEMTENVLWNAPAIGLNSVKERLERLSTVGTVDVTRTPSTRVVNGLLVTATASTLTVDATSTTTIAATGLAVGDSIWVVDQQFVITAVDPTTLTIGGTLITSVPVPVFKTAFGYQWLITFFSGHVGPQEHIKVSPSDSWTGNNPGITVESIQKGLQPISGMFRLSFASRGISQISTSLPHDVSADGMKAALENLVTVGLVNVTRTSNGYGYNWIVTFLTDVKSDISLLGVDGTELHGPSVRIMTAITNVGVQPDTYCEKNGFAGVATEISIPAPLTLTLGGLLTGQGYTVRVRAHNVQGYGGAGYISPAFQAPRTTPSAPKDVKLLVLSSRLLKVRWNPPDSNGGALITSYKIQWDDNTGFSNVNSPTYDMLGELSVQPTDTGSFYFNIPTLAVKPYFVRVIAVNDQGKGVAQVADPASATPLDRTPGQPENAKATVLSSYAILVEWDPSSTEKAYYGGDGGLSITQYMVEWDSSAAFDSPAAFGLVSGPTRSYIIGGNDPITGVKSSVLIPGATYYIRVTAFNAKGAGTPRVTDPLYVIAANQVPTAPRDLKLSVIPATSIKADWVNPLYDGGASLKSYEVEWDEQDDFSSGQSASATIPIVREIQSVVVSTDVVNEEQLVDATVEVINEQQVVRTLFTGADEIQIIETENDPVVDEIQTITTSATDRDEVQELRLDADDINEIQAIRTSVGEVFEVQQITVGATRVNEVQTIPITITGAATDISKIAGELYFTFNNVDCTHCTLTRGSQRTVNLISSLKESDDGNAAATVQDALVNLANIGTGGVTVVRTTTTPASDLAYVYTITFTGDSVTGDVPQLTIDSSIAYNTAATTGVTTNAIELAKGNEVSFDALSTFKVTSTCESYSDPYSITSFTTLCTPRAIDNLCTGCVTRFTGLTFTLTKDLTMDIAVSHRLVTGVCVFQVAAITATSITVEATDVGALCSTFTGQAFDLFKARKFSTNVQLKTAATVISAGSVVENLLNGIIDAVAVTRAELITTTFVGSVYEVTFRKRSGMIPMLECDATNVGFTNTVAFTNPAIRGATCTVARTTIGSMIAGTFVIGLARESDGGMEQTAPIPWDASEVQMKSAMEAVVSTGGEIVFGTVTVNRTVYSPTGNKWSGGYTWQIEFMDRGWNIPKMTLITNSLNSLVNSDATKPAPTVTIEDQDSPMNVLTAKSRHGNQVGGTMTLKFNGVTATNPCVIGTDTSLATPHQPILDTTFSAFLVANLAPAIPNVQVTRSAATQARGFTWTITFSDKATGGDVPMMEFDVTGLTGVNARAKFYETIKGNQLGGTFQLKFNGETTGPILFSADKLSVQAQLNSLSTIKPSSVLVDCVGPAISTATQVLGYQWLITFRSSVWADPTSDHSSGIPGNWKGARAMWDDVWPESRYSKAWGRHVGPMWSKGYKLTCIKDGLTTAAADNSQDCQAAVATPGVGPIKGTFTVTLDSSAANFMSVKQLVTSPAIAHNAWPTKAESGATGTSVEEILESMVNVGDVSVSRSQVNILTGGYTWTVTFLRDANGPCKQEEDNTNGVRLCNSPGDVPAMVADGTALDGSTPRVQVCEKSLGNCYPNIVQNGLILRGDFTSFKVTNDPGFEQRYHLTIACSPNAVLPCNPIQFFNIAAGSELIRRHLLVGDRFTIGTYSSCVFQVVGVTALQVEVEPFTCNTMPAGMNNDPRGVFIRVPWNADQGLVQRVLEASSDQASEVLGSIWEGGRKVSVERTIHGKYGEVSWQIRFISNPTFTPPGSGNLPDITTTFVPFDPASSYQVTVTQVTPGSMGLSGSFLVDFHSTIGPRQISFDEDEDRFQRKLNEMNTIGRVIVKKIKYPSIATGCMDSSCSGGWDDKPVSIPGTRGGYRWRIRFLKVTGEFGGLTFPSGSGNVGPLSVTVSTLQGNQKSIDVTTSMSGSSPILGGFVLNTTSKATPVLPYSSSSDSIKQGIESMLLFGEVDVTRDYLVTQKIPNAVATTSKDGLVATITGIDDVRLFVAPGDIIRFGPVGVDNLAGTNGDSPLTSVLATSKVTVSALSPIVRASDPTLTKLLYPAMQLRIDGLVYNIQRSGREVQTVAVTLAFASWDPTESRTYFQLKLTRNGASQTTACLQFNADYTTVENELNAKLLLLDVTAQVGDIKVTRAGPTTTEGGAQKGYVYSVYFVGDTVAGDVSALEAITTGCTGVPNAKVVVNTVTHGGAIGHQRISLATDSGQVADSLGYFKLKLNGLTTPCLTWGVSAENLEKSLETVLLTGDVLVARRGSGNSVTEVQRLRLTSSSEVTATNTGLFRLLFTIDGNTAVTNCLAYGISPEALQLELNQLSNIATTTNHVNVTRDGDGTSSWGYGYEYLINFRGPVAGGYSAVLGDINQLQIISVGQSPCAPVVGGNPALIIETVRQGSAGYDYDVFFLNYPDAVVPMMLLLDERVGECTANWIQNGGSSRKAAVSVITQGGSSEIQSLVVTDPTAAIPVGSSYKLSFGVPPEKTDCITFDASALLVQSRLTALSTIGAAGVQVSGDMDPINALNGFVYKITFSGQLVTGNVPKLQVLPNDPSCATTMPLTSSVIVTTATPGGQPSGDFVVTRLYQGEQPGIHVAYRVSQLFTVMNEQFDVQKVVVLNPGNDIATGTYKLTLNGVLTGEIEWNADESAVEDALTAKVVNAKDGDIVVTRQTDTAAAPNGYVYTIYFSGDSVKGNLAQMTASAKTNFGTGDVVVSTISNGVDGVSPFKANSIPLARVNSPTTPSPFLANDAALSVFKVNGFFWTIKFKSTVGNIPTLGMQTTTLTGKLAIVDDFVMGSASNSYVMTNLLPGINYYVHVAAATDIGLGPFTTTSSIIPSGAASSVQNIAAGYALYSREIQEVRLAATHITEVQEITTSAATMAEVQTLRTYASSDLCFTGQCVLGSFAFRIPTIQKITVSAFAPITAGSFSIQFSRSKSNSLGAFIPVGPVVDTETLLNIPWNAAASVVQSALEMLDSIDPGDIVVTRDGDGSSSFGYGYIYSITFVGNNVAGQTPTITVKSKTTGVPVCATCDAFVVAGGLAYSLSVDVNPVLAMGTDTAVQQVIVSAAKPLFTGSYRLIFDHLGAPMSSGCIVFDAPARGSDTRAMENVLEQMPNVDQVYVTRKVDPQLAPNGYIYRIFFYGNGVYGDVKLLQSTICTPFQTQESNVLTAVGVNGAVTISMVDPGGFNVDNTFVKAATATADQLNQDLDRLPVFGDVIVSQSLVDQQGGFMWTIAFKDSEGDLPQFICAKDAVFAATIGSGCETSTLTDGNVISGSFVIESSVPISFNANAVTVKAALEAMAWVGTVQVVQSPPSAQMGYTWTITFLDYFGDVPTLMVTSSLAGTGTNIQVREVRKGNSIAGAFTLSYMGSVTAPIQWNAKATAVDTTSDGSSMQEKLEALDVIGPLTVERSTMDHEGGMTWRITFLDNNLNPGDLPLLQANASTLTGVGTVAFVREVRKGSNAVGDQLWLSFDPPQSDNGSPITKYQVRWDTAATFTASPAEYFIAEPEILYRTQQIVTGAKSLAWSAIKTPQVSEVQTITIDNSAVTGDTFTLAFRGVSTTAFTVDTSTTITLTTLLSGLSTVGTVVVTPAATTMTRGSVFQVTFTTKLGDLPLLVPSSSKAVVDKTRKGTTSFRKEVAVFSCLGTTGVVKFTSGTNSVNINFDTTIAALEASLHTLFKVEAESITVSSTQAVMCFAIAPADIIIVFDRVYGDVDLTISSTTTTITMNTAASISGVYADVTTAKMSGTFQVGYNGKYTRSLNAESSANDVRYALEDLPPIQTVAVTKEKSYQALSGKVDVIKGQIFVTCSTGETCDFRNAGYGLPGYQIRIGGSWYAIRTDGVSDALDATKLYLGDLNGRETGYLGDSQTGMVVYEWMRGYMWTVSMLSVDDAPLAYLRAKIPRLLPSDSTVTVRGNSCDKCYYIPTRTTKKLTMGQEYFIEVIAFNGNGGGLRPVAGSISAKPSQVPNAPSNVDLAIVSGQQIEVFFSPPVLASTNVNANFNNDISSYIVQWDIRSDFKHGLPLCSSCAVSLNVNVLTVTNSLTTLLKTGSKFTIADEKCVLEVFTITATQITVVGGHNCVNFNTHAYPMYYYIFEPAVLSGLLIQGSPPYRYLISGLTLATKYYVRVAAVNLVPVQQVALDGNPPDNRKWSFPLSVTTKDTVPDPPVSVYLYPFSGTTLEVQIQPPTRDGKGLGGAAITHYWVDVDTVSTFDSLAKVAPVDVDVTGPNIPLLYPGGPRVYYIKNLNTGVRYFVQVKSKNSIGYSRATLAPNPLAPTRNPDGPVNVKVSTLTTSPTPIDSATVTWQKPVLDGGLPLTSYKVEWWGVEPRQEVQVIEIKWTTKPTSALFTLAFGGGKTGNLPCDVSPENLRSALMNILVANVQKIRHIQVTRSTVNIAQGYQWRVTFMDAFNAGDQPMIQFEFGLVTGGVDLTGRVFEAVPGAAVPQVGFPGKREVQVLMTYHATIAVGGFFRLSYKGSPWSNYLPAAATAANLELALESLATIGRVTVNLVGPSTNGLIWTVTFDANVGNLPALVVDSAKITPADAFVGVKDGDNAVEKTGLLCVPGEDVCPGTWADYKTGIAAMASPGEAVTDYQFYETIDANALTYKATGLVAGKTYYVSVTAKNALGLGTRVKSSPMTIVPPLQVPGSPTGVSVSVRYGVATQLSVTWDKPLSDGGGEVRMYRVQYDPSPLFQNRGQQDFLCPTAPTNAVWKIQTFRNGNVGDPIGDGYFNLLLTRNNLVTKTEPIPWDAVATAAEEVGGSSPATSKLFCTACPMCTDICDSAPTHPFSRREKSGSLQSKLSYLSSINSVQVVRTAAAAADGGYTWTITFMDVGDDFSLAPDAPNALTCARTPPATCTFGDYRVTATKLTAGTNNPPCTGTQVIPSIGALNKGQLYYVRVFAYNKVGFSLPLLAPSPQKPMVVPGPPTGVTLQVVGVSDLKVLFSPPDDDGGDTITAYQVEWSTNNAFTNVQTGVVSLLAGGAPYYRVISSLVKGTFYFVRVKAMNSQGYGQYQISSPASLNPYTTPSAPTQVLLGVTSSTMLTVQFNVPDDDGGDMITAYVVQWDISASFDSLGAAATTVKITDTTQRSYTITLLTPETVYFVRVFAVNAGGLGTPQTSTPPSQIPVNTRPGKPHTLLATSTVAPGTLLVNWQTPRVPAHLIPCFGTQLVPLSCPVFVSLDMVFGGSSFGSYTVQWSDRSDFSGFNFMSVMTNSALVTGLDSGKLYYVRVLTMNSQGDSSDFCARANSGGYLCPDNLVLFDGTVVTGAFVTATPN